MQVNPVSPVRFARPRNSYINRNKSSSSLPKSGTPARTVDEAPSDQRPLSRANTDEALRSPTSWFYKVSNTVASSVLPCSPAAKPATSTRRMAQTLSSGDESSTDEDFRFPMNASNRPGHASTVSSPTLSAAFSRTDALSENPSTVKIVAPNVSKLSRASVVEVRLNSINECVVVVCSIDVLKMRSGFFHDILREREENMILTKSKNQDALREPIAIPEISPYEAAAYLESLHEGRALFKGEWNMSWARLSVMWFVDEHQTEYAAQIESHISRLLSYIKLTNWRTNANVLSGCKIAIFRKNNGPTPTILYGQCIDATTSVVYSRVRVLFDSMKSGLAVAQSPIGVKIERAREPYPVTPRREDTPIHNTDTAEVVGDAELPFWVQREGGFWQDPDDMFEADVKTAITLTDRRIFWEMVRIIIEFPELTRYIASTETIRNTKDLAAVLRRPEYRTLWMVDAPQHIPKDAACELLAAAYISSNNFQA